MKCLSGEKKFAFVYFKIYYLITKAKLLFCLSFHLHVTLIDIPFLQLSWIFFHPTLQPIEIFFYISSPQPSGVFFYSSPQSIRIFYIDVASSDQTLCSSPIELPCANFIALNIIVNINYCILVC